MTVVVNLNWHSIKKRFLLLFDDITGGPLVV